MQEPKPPVDHWRVEPAEAPPTGETSQEFGSPWDDIDSPADPLDTPVQEKSDRTFSPTKLVKGVVHALRRRGSSPLTENNLSWDDLESDDTPRPTTIEDEWDWGSGIEDVEEPQRRTVLDKIRRHPKAAGGLLALTTVLAAGASIIAMKGGGDSKPADNSNKIVRTGDVNHNGHIEPNERISQADIDEIPNAKRLPPLLGKPILTKSQTKELKDVKSFSPSMYKTIAHEAETPYEIQGYKPKFISAYKSVEGVAFNFYAATQTGEESALNQHFQVNPQSIEYILAQIESNIGNAPENLSKHAIIDNLRQIKNGKKDSVINIVIDVSPTAGCMDPSYQLVNVMKAVCFSEGAVAGVTLGYDDEHSIIISAGGPVVMEASPAQKRVFEKTFKHNNPDNIMTQRNIRDVLGQQFIAEHEMIHALSDASTSNSLREDDTDHEITGWLINGYSHDPNYDFKGATGRPPGLGHKIEALVASGELPPILSVKR